MHPRFLKFGPLAIPTSGVFAAIAILAGLSTARITARRLGLDPEKLWDLGIAAILAALISPRIILILTNWADFRAHPLWMLGLLSVRSQPAVYGGLAVALALSVLYARLMRLPFRRTLDATAPAFALGLGIASVGNLIAGSRFGIPANLPWSITYSSRLASLWNGTPLGTPLHPVQLYAALIDFALFALLVAMVIRRDRWKLRDGEIMGALLFLQGITSFLLSFLRGDLAATTPADFLAAQMMCGFMVLAGGLLWLL